MYLITDRHASDGSRISFESHHLNFIFLEPGGAVPGWQESMCCRSLQKTASITLGVKQTRQSRYPAGPRRQSVPEHDRVRNTAEALFKQPEQRL